MLRLYLQLAVHRLRAHGENRNAVQRVARTLRIEIEATHRSDLVAPPLDAGRRRHAESVDVQDPAPHAVLRDFRDGGHARVTHDVEPPGGVGQTPFLFTDLDYEPRLLERRRDCSPLRGGSHGRDQYAHRAAKQRLERLDPLTRELVMRLLGAERLALGIECGGVGSQQRLQIREPALAIGGGRRDDRKDTLRQPPWARRVPEKPSAAKLSALKTDVRSLPPNAAVTSAVVAGVRSDSRASGPNTVAPIVSVPRVRNSTWGAPSAAATSASPITIRLTSASTNGTNPGAAGGAVQAVSRRLPSNTTEPDLTSQGSPLTVASTSLAPSSPLPAASIR